MRMIKPEGTEWIADAFKTPLGPISGLITDPSPMFTLRSTKQRWSTRRRKLHEGWRNPQNGRIVSDQTFQPMGGPRIHSHRIRRKWLLDTKFLGRQLGAQWLCSSPYTDWSVHAMDTWVGQLGVYRSTHLESLVSGLDLRPLSGRAVSPQAAQSILLSGNSSISAQQINPI